MKRDLLLILLFSFFFFIFGNWILSLTSLDEGRNFYASLHMYRTGDYLVPYYNCEYRFEKPPLLYWLANLSFHLFGVNEFSARLISGLAATGTTFLVYLFGLKFLSNKKALFSAVVYMLFLHNWVESRAFVPEFILVFFSSLALYFFISKKYTLGWLSLSLAFLSKGPVGVFLPLTIYLLWSKDIRVFRDKGIFLFFLLGFSWYFAMILKFGWEYFFKFFVYENIFRFTGQYVIHERPFYFYPLLVLFSAVLFLPLIPALFRKWERKLNFFLVWFLTVLVFYTLSSNKLHHYILFAYPPFALMLGSVVKTSYLKKALFIGSFLLLTLLGTVYLFEKERFTPKAVRYLENYKGEVYFYRHENSAIVAYLYRCIPKKDKFPSGSMVITKEKHLKELKEYEIITKGKEFGGNEVLIRILR